MLSKLKLAFLSLALLAGSAGIAAAKAPGPGQGGDRIADHARHGKHKGKAKQHRVAKRGDVRVAKRAEMLQRYDVDKDGKLDGRERATMKRERAAKKFAALDTNRDGRLDLAEFSAGMGKGKGRHGMVKRP